MGIWRFATFSRNARNIACVGNRMSSPKVRCHDRAGSPSRADDPDRPRPLHDDPIALSICAQHPIAAGLVVGPDDVRDVGVGNERYDAVLSSGNGVGSEVDGGHYKSSCGSRFHLRTSGPGPLREPLYPQRASLYVRIRRQRVTKPRGWDAAKRLKGRKRHIAVDTDGLLLGILVHAADIQDADGLGDLLKRLKPLYA